MAAKNNNKAIEMEIFERQANLCKSFAHPKRLQLLDLLGKSDRQVSELQSALNVSKANLSQHLALLKAAGVISTRRVGKQVICSLALQEVKQACSLIREVLRSQLRGQRRLMQ
jgi:ArsR family transcriptional regulator